MNYPQIMGILNITPDSFSDGGDVTKAAVLARLEQMLADGADIIDVGAESTRPGATPLSHEEEWLRLEPVMDEIVNRSHVADRRVSLDTRHPQTALLALDAGVDIINDVSGCANPAMTSVLAAGDCDIVCMHALTLPADPSVVMHEGEDVVAALLSFAEQRITSLTTQGIAKERLMFDPGIGFNKTATQSWELLRRVQEFKALGVGLLIGHSRKSFLSTVTDAAAPDRDAHTLAISQYLLHQPIEVIRVHNVKLHRELIEMVAILHASK